jgi:hypothetical protein
MIKIAIKHLLVKLTEGLKMTPEVTKTVLYLTIYESQFNHIFSRQSREKILVKLT